MAATVSAWNKPGAWAQDSEDNEAELLQQLKQDSVNSAASGGDAVDFPSLAAAATTKTKKKKPQPQSLQEFTKSTTEVPLHLPTAPRQRSAEELDRNKLGGGFKSYGYDRSSRDDQPRRQRDTIREGPSRADETDDWGAAKKFSGGSGFERRERGERSGFFSDSQSKADESDNWASNKAFVPSEPRRYDKGRSFGLESSNGAADSDNWLKKKEEEGKKFGGGAFDSLRERRGGTESNGANSETWGRRRESIESNGGANSENWGKRREEGSGGRPRLNLQPRTLPVDEGQKGESGVVSKPKGSNPFGEARPREEVLKEKGQDWKEIEEKLESMKVKGTSPGSSDGSASGKRSFWSGNGRERLDKERAWRKMESADSRPQSAEKSENGHAEQAEDGSVEAGDKDPEM